MTEGGFYFYFKVREEALIKVGVNIKEEELVGGVVVDILPGMVASVADQAVGIAAVAEVGVVLGHLVQEDRG